MQTTPITYDDLRSSVISVPPLARKADLSLNDAENTKLIRHLEAGGVRTFLYGGNANLYNIAVSEYAKLLEYLAGAVAPTSIVVPSVGPFYGNIVDQADILKSFKFPTAMILPTLFPAKPAGIQVAVRHFVERSGIPAVLYIKDESYITPEAAAQLVNEGLISWIKYAVVRDNPAVDPYLTKLIDLVDRKLIVSGIGEQPAIIRHHRLHLRLRLRRPCVVDEVHGCDPSRRLCGSRGHPRAVRAAGRPAQLARPDPRAASCGATGGRSRHGSVPAAARAFGR